MHEAAALRLGVHPACGHFSFEAQLCPRRGPGRRARDAGFAPVPV